MLFKHWVKVLGLAGFIASGVGSAHAQTLHKVNASSVGNSWRLLNWLNEAGQTPVPCSPSCNYMRISTAMRAPDTATIFTPTTWPNTTSTSFPSPSNVERSLAFTPPDSKIYQSTVLERGAVDYARTCGAKILGIVGRDGGHTARVADAHVIIPTVNPRTVTPHCEALQAVIWHLLVSHPRLGPGEAKWESTES